jgi:hypothetical protein
VDDVIYILRCLGGAAHLTTIMSAVQAKIRQDRGGEVSRTLASDIASALEAYDLDNPERSKPALFHRPFGPGSNRWAVIGH